MTDFQNLPLRDKLLFALRSELSLWLAILSFYLFILSFFRRNSCIISHKKDRSKLKAGWQTSI